MLFSSVRLIRLVHFSIRRRLRLCLLVLAMSMTAAHSAFGQTYVDIHDFGYGTDGTLPYAGVTLDNAGNMYGTTLYGGSDIAGQVWKLSASGDYQVLHVFGGTYDGTIPDGNDPKGGVTLDSSGNLYGATVGGGAYGGGIVWEITASGNYLILHSFYNGNDGLGPEAGVTIDRYGNLYGTTGFWGANLGGGNVWEITASGQYRDLHDFGSGADGAGSQANVTIDGSGNLYGTTYGGGANGWGIVWEITSSGKYLDLHDFGAGSDGTRPIGGVTLDSSGNLFGTTLSSSQSESGPGTLWEITATGTYQLVHTFGSSGDGSQPNAGVSIDPSGKLYGTATKGGANSGGVLWSFSNGNYSVLHSFGSGADGTYPLAGVTIDAAGNLFGCTYHGGANGPNCGMIWGIVGVTLGHLTITPTTLLGGASATGTITISGAAPSGGIPIALNSSSASVSLPGSVTVAAGAKSATFLAKTASVSTTTTATITASLGTSSQSVTLTVNAPLLAGVSLNPSNVVGGNSSTGTVTFNRPAPAGGTVVTLGSSSSSATLPASVTVAEGSTSATFRAGTSKVTSAVTVTISAAASGTTVSTALVITSDQTAAITLNPSTVIGGLSTTGTVKLTKAAGSGGVVVSLTSDNSSATVPSSVTVASGSSSATFVVSTTVVGAATQVAITATLNGTSQAATLILSPLSLVGLTLNPTRVGGGSSSTGTVTITAPAGASGTIISLSASNSAAVPPVSVTIAPHQVSATFTIATVGVPVQRNAMITASLSGASVQASLTITAPALVSVNFSPSSVVGGASSTGTIQLSGVAGPNGLIIGLSSSNSIASLPNSVLISSGQSSASFMVTTSAVTSPTPSTITASLSGKPVTTVLTVVPVGLASISLAPATVPGGSNTTGTVTLNAPAPTRGLVVNLSANSPSVRLPASVTIAAGKTSASFAAKTTAVSAQEAVRVTAKFGANSASTTLTVLPPVLSKLSLAPSTVAGGTSSVGTVQLSGPAGAGGLVVKLSSNSAAAAVPASVTIRAGQSSATFKIETAGTAVDTTATISANANGQSLQAALSVTSPKLSSLTLIPSSLKGGQSGTAVVELSSVAPAGGLTVSLSGSQSAVSVPATVSIPAGKTRGTFKVKTVGVTAKTSANISATLQSTSKSAVLTIN